MIKLNTPTPIDKITINERSFYIKRDDLIDDDFSGNKARKLHYFLHNEFLKIKKIISYGSAQSNAMYSLSVLAKMRGWEFDYFVDHIAAFLIENPNGNYEYALKNGMNIIIGKMKTNYSDDSVLYIEEGGRIAEAAFGLEILANEIMQWQRNVGISKLNIVLPSGTGTTALFLQKSLTKLGSSIKVYTTPCVGDSDYLKEQFSMLEIEQKYHPIIIEPQKKWHFGKLYREHYEIWIKLRNETNIEFDMLYDPIGWQVLLGSNLVGDILYIHQGGLLGNVSMRARYERKYKDLYEDFKNR